MTRRSATLQRLAHLIVLSGVAVVCAGASPARADQYLEQANRAAAATSGTKPAEDVLFPALAAMDEPPMRLELTREGMRDLMLAQEGDPSWDALVKWATADPQQKVIEAMKTVADPDTIYILGIPYGKEGVKPEWVDKGLYVELGPDDLLYGAQFHYLDRLGWAAGLALFESARLASEGKGDESLQVMQHLVRLSRILAERAFAKEKATAVSLAMIAMERTRDVVFTYSDAMTPELLEKATDTIEFKALNADKIPLPEADKLAAQQIVERTYLERGAAKPKAMAEMMSRAEAGDRPLRLFSLAAWWTNLAQGSADWFDTTDEINGVWNDYVLRWKLDFNDPLLERPSEFRQMDPKKYPVIYEAMKGIEPLFLLRKSFWVDLGGTYNGLGVMAFKLQEKNYPPQIAAIDPKFVKERVKDMYNLDTRYMRPQMRDYPYWVPIRDQKFDRRESPHPYDITVYLSSGAVGSSVPGGPQIPTPREMMSKLRTELGLDFSDFPTGVFDEKSFTLDADKLREYLLGKVEDMRIPPESLAQWRQSLAQMNADGMTPENARQKITDGFKELRDQPMVAGVIQGMGIDLDKLEATLADFAEESLREPALQKALSAVESGGDLSLEDERAAISGFIKTALQPKYVDPMMEMLKKVKDSPMMQQIAQETQAFGASLDDSYFLLYSCGQNGKDDRAKNVGPAGIGAEDILIWPAVITLERRFNQ